MKKIGTWWIRSKKDPRWNRDGRGEYDIFEAEAMMKNLINEIGESLGAMPDDLEINFMKD